MENLNAEYDIVFVLDCLPKQDREDFNLSEEILGILDKHKIPRQLINIDNKVEFLRAFDDLKAHANAGTKFLLQIISHGTSKGLELGETAEKVFWKEMRDEFYEINKALSNTLLLNMTACKGLNGAKIVDENLGDYPFFGLIGCYRDLWTPEASKVNEVFYTGLLNGQDISTLIPEMQNAIRGLINGEGDEDAIFGITAQGYKTIRKGGSFSH